MRLSNLSKCGHSFSEPDFIVANISTSQVKCKALNRWVLAWPCVGLCPSCYPTVVWAKQLSDSSCLVAPLPHNRKAGLHSTAQSLLISRRGAGHGFGEESGGSVILTDATILIDLNSHGMGQWSEMNSSHAFLCLMSEIMNSCISSQSPKCKYSTKIEVFIQVYFTTKRPKLIWIPKAMASSLEEYSLITLSSSTLWKSNKTDRKSKLHNSHLLPTFHYLIL